MNAKLAVLVGGLMMLGGVGAMENNTMEFGQALIFAFIGTACALEGAMRLSQEQV